MNGETKYTLLLLVVGVIIICAVGGVVGIAGMVAGRYGTIAGFAALLLPIVVATIAIVVMSQKKNNGEKK